MDYYFTQDEVNFFWNTAEQIQTIIGRAMGREERYQAQRDEFKVLDFTAELAKRKSRMEQKPMQPIASSDCTAKTEFLEFTPKEISKMPTFFRKEFRLKGGTVAHIRVKPNGSYEIRYRRGGINISVSAKTVEAAKERFIEKLCESKTAGLNGQSFFGQYATQWLEVVKKPQVKETTYEDYKVMFRVHIFPKFGKMRIRDIKPIDVQKLINSICEKKTFRNAEKVYVLLHAVFNFAVAENVIAKSPMALIKKPVHEAKHGQAFTVEEERRLVEKCLAENTPYGFAFIFMLYTGLRRAELSTVTINAQWVTLYTAKNRHGTNPKMRKIPISPMLRPFIPLMNQKIFQLNTGNLSRIFAKYFPGRHLHELRHTFITRCQECGISRELTSLWAGHRADNTMTSNVYTHFSEEFQLGEIQKLRY